MLVYWKILAQSFRLSFEEIRTSKLRSSLSLMGVAIGVLCVVSVRTAVTSLDKNIRNSFASLGTDILYIQKWPWIFSDDYPWWKFLNRPVTNEREMQRLAAQMHTAQAIAMMDFAGGKTAKYLDRSLDEARIQGVTEDFYLIKNMEFTHGRYFTQNEFNNAGHVCLLGANIAAALFGNSSPELKEIRIAGIKMKVIGVLKKEGDDLFGFSQDNEVLIPYKTLSLFNDENDPMLALKPKDGIAFDEMKYEARGAMRAIRRLAPNQEDNFALNKMSVFVDGLTSLLDFVGFAGMIIGGFSMLVGGFGIANIMFVSVKERTNIIGIKKALGAKQIYILMEFLLEAVLLSLLGGLVGLFLMFIIIQLLQWYLVHIQHSSFVFYITVQNLVVGFFISFTVGVISGFIPAWQASKMRPVDAIRS